MTYFGPQCVRVFWVADFCQFSTWNDWSVRPRCNFSPQIPIFSKMDIIREFRITNSVLPLWWTFNGKMAQICEILFSQKNYKILPISTNFRKMVIIFLFPYLIYSHIWLNLHWYIWSPFWVHHKMDKRKTLRGVGGGMKKKKDCSRCPVLIVHRRVFQCFNNRQFQMFWFRV